MLIIEYIGEKLFPERCARVWLGATDLEEEGVWRDAETNEVLDLNRFWNAGQPNGVRIQNCAGIWEMVRAFWYFLTESFSKY